jgi:hypothetical protein
MTCPALPSRLEDLEREVNGLFGQHVTWKQDLSIGGAMICSVERGAPRIKYREFTEEGAAHELLHLRLLGASYPEVKCYENQRHARGAATMLSNCLQHSQIFPILEDWGYQPRLTESQGLKRQLTTLPTSDLARLLAEFGFEALLAMLHVRALLDCSSSELSADLKSICPPDTWERVERVSTRVLQSIDSTPTAMPAQAELILKTCLDHLGISQVATVAKHEP